MIVVRSTLYAAMQFITCFAFLPVSLVARLFKPVPGNRIISHWARFNTWWLRVTCGLTYEVRGLENLPEEPCVIASKHQSAWETIAYQSFMPPLCYVIKRELLWIPVFGWGLACAHPISINRSEGSSALKSVVSQGKSRIDTGLSVCVFPEGTRTDVGVRVKHNPGAAILAVQAGVKVVPVAHNAGLYWKKNGFIKRPGVVQVRIGPAIESAGRKPRDLAVECENWIESESEALLRGLVDVAGDTEMA